MKQWQKVEKASIASTAKIISKTENPVILQIMEIIQKDSLNHYHIQELIRSNLEEKSLKLTTDELVDIWDLIENHLNIEKETIELAKESLESLKGKKW